MLPLTLKGAQRLDLNYLYHRRGQSLMMAAHAACEPSRSAHIGLACAYVAKIDQARRDHAVSHSTEGLSMTRDMIAQTAFGARN